MSSLNMASLREFPVKSLPKCLLLDLRRRGIRVPQEVQMRIMYFKEIAETRRKKTAVGIEISVLPMCGRFEFARTPGLSNEWRQVAIKPRNRRLNTPCHHCKRHFEHALSIDMMAEVSNQTPNLDRLYNACMAYVIELYRYQSPVRNVGDQICHTGARPSNMNSVDKIWDALAVSLNAVFIILSLEQQQLEQLEEEINNE